MIGHKLDQLLTALKLTPEEFAEEIKVGKSTIYKLLRGDTKKLTRSMARKINDNFPDYSIDFLLAFNNEKKESANEDYFKDLTQKDTKIEKEETLENLIGESVYRKIKPELDDLKKRNRELTELLLGLIPVSEEILKKVSEIQNTGKY